MHFRSNLHSSDFVKKIGFQFLCLCPTYFCFHEAFLQASHLSPAGKGKKLRPWIDSPCCRGEIEYEEDRCSCRSSRSSRRSSSSSNESSKRSSRSSSSISSRSSCKRRCRGPHRSQWWPWLASAWLLSQAQRSRVRGTHYGTGGLSRPGGQHVEGAGWVVGGGQAWNRSLLIRQAGGRRYIRVWR